MKKRIRKITEEEKRSLGEQQMLSDWMKIFPKGILSVVSDTFDLWKLITEYLPALKDEILARDGKLVIRPDSGDPVDITCGIGNYVEDGSDSIGNFEHDRKNNPNVSPTVKGVVELLWDIFGGTINEQGYKLLDPHIGAIYGDSITPERQVEIYKRLEAKGFAATNIVLGIGSFTYQYNTRDTLGFAAKGAWFEVKELVASKDTDAYYDYKTYNIYKDPVTDDGTKKSLKGLLMVGKNSSGYVVHQEVSLENENKGELQLIYQDGNFFNQTSLTEIREKIKNLN